MKRKSGTADAIVLALLALIHLYWAAGGKRLLTGALPAGRGGKPAFEPGAKITLVVAGALGTAAGTVFAASRSVPHSKRPALAVAGVFALRAVGDFHHVGFFKRQRRGRFARLDTWVYSPLCALISALSLGVAR